MADFEMPLAISFQNKCSFFLKRKNRYCKMIPGKGKKFCGEHSYLELGQNEVSAKRKRINCPLDENHTVFEDQLEKHLKKCNVTKKRQVEYYEKNINNGQLLTDTNHQLKKQPLKNIPKEDIQLCIEKIRSFFKEIPLVIKESYLSQKNVDDEIDETSPVLGKHLQQQSSLIGNMRAADLLASNSIYVEFGAGRGMLSHWVQKSMKDIENIDFLLVDRASCRYKADSYHRRIDQGPTFNRIQIDIQHLNLKNVPLISNSDQYLTGVSKHLCGAATDLALRCLMNTSESSRSVILTQKRADERVCKRMKLEDSRVNGLAFALCCHHCCSWDTYVAREFLEFHGFNEYYFNIVCGLTSWATCGSRHNVREKKTNGEDTLTVNNAETLNNKTNGDSKALQDKENVSCLKSLGLSKSESEHIGRQSKRLLDVGRLSYLNKHDLDTCLVYYVDRSVSLENVALIAWNRKRCRGMA
ncbi:tRNA:m(4)X modification enzyme TRM13 homolog [Xenia sp. Carnegie-2017]|uniref:tRNA:m(4)X modification enzyme TRM13 homolog n=1 Tax=Xenia sp. Carnegie-2017 TaxID=2897299 RepID=UPI001F049A91|nr:tRNA:m(4)X modification enzyme TRM13 homolog [Xenia sp. Carnegie-2017]